MELLRISYPAVVPVVVSIKVMWDKLFSGPSQKMEGDSSKCRICGIIIIGMQKILE